MRITVIIPTRGPGKALLACLGSLKNQEPPPFEILIVINSADPRAGSIKKLTGEVSKTGLRNVRIIHERRKGVSFCRNLGIKTARGDYLAFLDDDCEADGNWLREINRRLRNSAVPALTGRVSADHETNCLRLSQYFRCKRIFEDTLTVSGGKKYSTFVDTKNFVIRKSVILENGLFFDENTPFVKFSACEDLDLGLRLKQKKIPVICCDGVVVRHPGTDSPVCLFKREFEKGRAFFHFRAKWPGYRLRASRPALAGEILNPREGDALLPVCTLAFFLVSYFFHKAGCLYERITYRIRFMALLLRRLP